MRDPENSRIPRSVQYGDSGVPVIPKMSRRSRNFSRKSGRDPENIRDQKSVEIPAGIHAVSIFILLNIVIVFEHVRVSLKTMMNI